MNEEIIEIHKGANFLMRKKHEYIVATDLSDLDIGLPGVNSVTKPIVTIHKSLENILKQMKSTGLRERTMSDYKTQVNHFERTTGVKYTSEIKAEHIYEWLSSMQVSNQTKLTRLKCLKAFLGRCYNQDWIRTTFWKDINVKVDSPLKEGASDIDVYSLLGSLNLHDFIQLRDAVAILIMYKTGLRLATLSELKFSNVDFDEKIFRIEGALLKNHQQIHLPFDEKLLRLLLALYEQNKIIRKAAGVKNDNIFITQRGVGIKGSTTNNVIRKRLSYYAKMHELKNMNPHALRRGFAKNLLNKGADIALISKALGHSDIAVTTRYLHFDKSEVAKNLRGYL